MKKKKTKQKNLKRQKKSINGKIWSCLGKPVVFQQQIHSELAVPLCCSWHLTPKCRKLVKYCPIALKFRGETSQGILMRNLKALSNTPF